MTRSADSRVEICSARDCRHVVASIEGQAGRGAPERALPNGRYYWRLRAGTETSRAWWFEIRNVPGARQSSPGDVSGDGFADVFLGVTIGPPPAQSARLFVGGQSGLDLNPRGTFPAGSEVLASPHRGHIQRGDFNGDGAFDFVFAPPHGAPQVVLGPKEGFSDGHRGRVISLAPESPHQARSVTVADINGDGFDDVIAARPIHGSFETDPGELFIYLGRTEGPAPAPAQTLSGAKVSLYQWGTAIQGLGDLNGDGFDDVAVTGFKQIDSAAPTHPIALRILWGSSRGLDTAASTLISTGADARADEWRAAWLTATRVGDVNGDALDDFVICARGEGNDYLTSAVLGAPTPSDVHAEALEPEKGCDIIPLGDVNGDGFADMASNHHGSIRYGGAASRSEAFGGDFALRSRPVFLTGPSDIDGDGYGDLVARTSFPESIWVLYGNTEGILTRSPETRIVGPSGGDVMSFGQWAD